MYSRHCTNIIPVHPQFNSCPESIKHSAALVTASTMTNHSHPPPTQSKDGLSSSLFLDQWQAIESNTHLPEQQRLDSLFLLASSLVANNTVDSNSNDSCDADLHKPRSPTPAISNGIIEATDALAAPLAPRAHKKQRQLIYQSRSSASCDCGCDSILTRMATPHSGCCLAATTTITTAAATRLKTFPCFPSFPPDILFQVFGLLDAHSLLKASRVCSHWHSLITLFEKTYWRNLCKRTWNISNNSLLAASWKELYMMHDNIHRCGDSSTTDSQERYLFSSFKDKFQISSDTMDSGSVRSKTLDSGSVRSKTSFSRPGSSQPTQKANLFAWPTNPQLTYTVAIGGNAICWVNAMAYSSDLNVAIIGSSPSDSASSVSRPSSVGAHASSSTSHLGEQASFTLMSQPYPFSASNLIDIVPPAAEPLTLGRPLTPFVASQRVLRGHLRPVSLVLANHDGNFVSFDDSSTIIVWRISDFAEHCRINPIVQLGVILSMNVHRRHIVGGGHTGKIVVWNMDTSDIVATFMVPQKYIGTISPTELLNVGIWDDLVVCGLYDGTFYVHSIATKQLVYCLSNADFPCSISSNLAHVARDLSAIPPNMESLAEAVPASAHVTDPQMSVYTGTGEPNDIQANSDLQAGLWSIESPDAARLSLPPPHAVLPPLETVQINPPSVAPLPLPLPLPLPPHHQHTSHVPMTLAMNGHILITNGRGHNEIAVWDMTTGHPLCVLSESIALARDGFSIPDFREIRFAELAHDGSCIFSSVAFEGNLAMLIWDFRSQRRSQRVFSKLVLDEAAQIEVWICMESC
ncbi:hypothetical protein BASA50_004603 [Batrachochytrium salamandrivorans]|uniref:F-box domain-containing protein n=1 Tax=Batrachochytrium salamandrivorans TaxID=1357716 RepID=A0ABQ8FI08_9FUNG|nr:hypothetical protein BASA50_004603 [Batrachochytrium salamandrivorans]KAH6602418.1 hypothetical protein BASA61_001130 [Batrachochytrium salamandrivorans]KAH9268165.1 hypothetical protein BASA84_000360 [Batrachochytrium salamandrivorans]